MGRYNFLTEKDILTALYRLDDAFLAAKDGHEVKEIINSLLTEDEKIRIGRRILIAEALRGGMKFKELVDATNVGFATITWVSKQLVNHPFGFQLIFKRRTKLEKEYESKKYRSVGGSTLIYKKKEYTGIKRSDIKR